MPSHAFAINKNRLIRFGSKVSLIDRPQRIVRDTIIQSENAYLISLVTLELEYNNIIHSMNKWFVSTMHYKPHNKSLLGSQWTALRYNNVNWWFRFRDLLATKV
jgi:hypothetical protein